MLPNRRCRRRTPKSFLFPGIGTSAHALKVFHACVSYASLVQDGEDSMVLHRCGQGYVPFGVVPSNGRVYMRYDRSSCLLVEASLVPNKSDVFTPTLCFRSKYVCSSKWTRKSRRNVSCLTPSRFPSFPRSYDLGISLLVGRFMVVSEADPCCRSILHNQPSSVPRHRIDCEFGFVQPSP